MLQPLSCGRPRCARRLPARVPRALRRTAPCARRHRVRDPRRADGPSHDPVGARGGGWAPVCLALSDATERTIDRGGGMSLAQVARGAYRVVTAAKDGPTLFELCDPVLAGNGAGTRICARSITRRSPIRRCGCCCRAQACRSCATARASGGTSRQPECRARDDADPDWARIGKPRRTADRRMSVADDIPRAVRHVGGATCAVAWRSSERIISACAGHLLGTFLRGAAISRPMPRSSSRAIRIFAGAIC